MNKTKIKPSLLNASHENSAKIAQLEEKLHEIVHKIHQLQVENMLKVC